MRKLRHGAIAIATLGAAAVTAMMLPAQVEAQQGWQPSKPVTFIIPAGTGGGADQMARFIQGIVQKHGLMKQSLVTVNKGGGAGAEGFMEVKNSKDPHTIIITLSNLFTTPMATGSPFNWKDMTPVAMMALDQFILWVNKDAPYKTAAEFVAAIKSGPDKALKMGGTGSKQEDQIITAALERLTAPKKMIYVPYGGGGAVAVQLVGKHVDSSVNNPIEAVSHWKAGNVRALCLFDEKRSVHKAKVTSDQSWADVPTCREAGVDVVYQMLRGIFMPASATPEQVAFYVDLLKKVRATPEWQRFIEDGAFNDTFMVGPEFKTWVENAERQHHALMSEAGFLKK